jgi:hypothetical protein
MMGAIHRKMKMYWNFITVENVSEFYYCLLLFIIFDFLEFSGLSGYNCIFGL